MSNLDALVKEFVAASSDEKKSVFSNIEDEVEKLKGSTERYLIGFLILILSSEIEFLVNSYFAV